MATALITGASTGIGRELAFLAAAAGYDLVLVARTAEQLEEVATQVRNQHNRQASIVTKDLSRQETALELFREVSQIHEDIEVLINNAGFGLLGFFAEMDADRQMQMVNLNVGALTHLSRLFAPGMIARRKGYILNVASTAAFQPGPLMAVYYATKAYVVSFSSALHNELKEHGVAVTTLCPGPTLTEFQKRANMASTALFKGPGVMSARSVAEIGFRALMKRKPLVVAGKLNATMAFLTRFAPRQLAASLARKVQEI
jgi:short-subunit dehydrogenase